MDQVEKDLLYKVAGIKGFQVGSAFNLRQNGIGIERHSTTNVQIVSKSDQPGIIIKVAPFTKNENVHIPVIVTNTGVDDLVYNDFEIGEGATINIVAGCGIHNDGCESSSHDGIHTFHIGKGASVTYEEKHYGEGVGSGKRVLNPTTILYMQENSFCEMNTTQISGVDTTKRKLEAHLEAGAHLLIHEKLLTSGNQIAHSDVDVMLNGEDASVQIVSRSVAKGESRQVFHPRAIGNAKCRAHVQCDSIIMDHAKVASIPEIAANHVDAQIVHEAAIGKINSDQLIKLQTFGLNESEAEEVIVNDFLK
ncbi:MAG: SufD family Fe-S cluster assembly protein [Erysipelotrichaceae bacterium]